jgi:hypothetical protein
MKNHKQILLFGFFILFSFATSCSSGTKNKMIGTWRAADVQAEFDEQRFTPEMLEQVIHMEKQVFFKFLNDSMMSINTLDLTNQAYWYFDEKTGVISYRFTDAGSALNELGIFKNDRIIAESQTVLGKLTIVYAKDE